MPSIAAEEALDITRLRCPMTYVRVRLALERLSPGQVLAVRLAGEDARVNVPANAQRQGHRVLGEEVLADGQVVLRIQRG